MAELFREVPEDFLYNTYIAMLDAHSGGAENQAELRRCLNYLEKEHRFRPPEVCGYPEECDNGH